MKEITKKLRRKAADSFIPVAEQLEKEGMARNVIMDMFHKFVEVRIKNYYKNQTSKLSKMDFNIEELERKADSKAETIFYFKLDEAGMPFTFQHRIGPHRVDFLIAGYLVFEVDGPSHFSVEQRSKDSGRDEYLQSMGYSIFRVPIWLIAMDPEAVIEEIRSEVSNFIPIEKKCQKYPN